MHVHVAVAVHVRKTESRFVESFKLRVDFTEQFLPGSPGKKISQTGQGRVGRKRSIFAGNMRDFRRAQDRASGGAGNVKPDSKTRVLFCQGYRVFECLAGDDEAGARQNSTAVSKDNSLINFPGRAEIICVYNKTARFHL
jgi:hypothetical protein